METEKINHLCDLLEIDSNKIKTTKIDGEKIFLFVFMFLFIMCIVFLTIYYLV